MCLFKSLFALGIATVLSASSLAETTNLAVTTKNSAKTTVEQINSVKISTEGQTDSVKNAVNSNKEKVTNKAVSVKKNDGLSEKDIKTKTDKVRNTTVSKINVNTADAKTLQSLTGIGEIKAKEIIEYRNKVGKIGSASELLNISGIGNATVEKVIPYLTF